MGVDTEEQKEKFYNFQTLTTDILTTILLSTQEKPTLPRDLETLPASSNLIFEIYDDDTVKGLLNDEEFALGGCTLGTPCKLDNWKAHLQSNASKIQNVEDYCKSSSSNFTYLQ